MLTTSPSARKPRGPRAARGCMLGTLLFATVFLLTSVREGVGITVLRFLFLTAAALEKVEQSALSGIANTTSEVDRILISWEDCGINATTASQSLMDIAALTEDMTDDINASVRRPYRGRILDVRVVHTDSGAPSDPPLTLPLGENMTVIVISQRDIPMPTGSFFEESTVGFPFSHSATTCDSGGITLPLGMGGTWGPGTRCPSPAGIDHTIVTVITPMLLPMPPFVDVNSLEIGIESSTYTPDGEPITCIRQMFKYLPRPEPPPPPPPPPPPAWLSYGYGN
mmetsp:Transcript_21757/g.66041  ORF Transcript_21757/g.66041 Transcript_21757/m.66041 type:complete len:282 (+) Transcript_21757:45-890(+)